MLEVCKAARRACLRSAAALTDEGEAELTAFHR